MKNIMIFLQFMRKVITVYLGKYEVTSIVNQTNDSGLLIPEQKTMSKVQILCSIVEIVLLEARNESATRD